MSFSLAVSGHHNDPDTTAKVEELVATKLRELVAAVDDVDPDCLYSAYVSGATVSTDLPKMRAEREADTAPEGDGTS